MENGFENYDYLRHDPYLDSLQEDADFMALMEGK